MFSPGKASTLIINLIYYHGSHVLSLVRGTVLTVNTRRQHNNQTLLPVTTIALTWNKEHSNKKNPVICKTNHANFDYNNHTQLPVRAARAASVTNSNMTSLSCCVQEHPHRGPKPGIYTLMTTRVRESLPTCCSGLERGVGTAGYR